MKKLIFFTAILFFLLPTPALAQVNVKVETKVDVRTESSVTRSYLPTSGYKIEDFQSEISVNQDTSLTIQETIKVNFFEQKHGLFRIIPVIYSARGRTIRAKLDILSVTDDQGTPYPYETSRYHQSFKIKIGAPHKTITGRHTYIIRYQINQVLLRYPEHDEVYWNVTGHEWDTIINNASAVVRSPFAKITKTDCFAGQIKTQDKYCQTDFSDQQASFKSTTTLGRGLDFTLVVALDKNNQLQFPGLFQRIIDFCLDNWGYPLALAPLTIILFSWYRRGRDKRYLSDNIYYPPENQKTRTVSLFEHKHLPLVYSPIDQVTPAQVGTIIDERVDIQDVVAEIVELARLGYLEIKRIERKGLFRQKNDYLFIKKEKDPKALKNYQKYLLDKLFFGQKINKLLKEALKLAKLSPKKVKAFSQLTEKEPTAVGNTVLLSSLKNKFYKYLDEFKKKLYQNLADEEIFAANPEVTRRNWLGLAILLLAVSLGLTALFSLLYFNAGPVLLLLATPVPTVMFAGAMPRRRAWGYSLYRQAEGLRYYLKLGKWRTEIHEKHLFFEEILPLAISLGVVKKLAKDMAVLGVEPPDYFTGFTAYTFSRDFSSFNKSSRSSLLASPPASHWTGKSSWSGGSGFGGGSFAGSAGGGFGGGGGGSW